MIGNESLQINFWTYLWSNQLGYSNIRSHCQDWENLNPVQVLVPPWLLHRCMVPKDASFHASMPGLYTRYLAGLPDNKTLDRQHEIRAPRNQCVYTLLPLNCQSIHHLSLLNSLLHPYCFVWSLQIWWVEIPSIHILHSIEETKFETKKNTRFICLLCCVYLT